MAKPRFGGCLLAVDDIEASKKFYTGLLDQKIAMDLGWNVSFESGFTLQSHFAELVALPPDTVIKQSHNMELYFEVADFDQFLAVLQQQPEIVFVHPPKKYEWQQRVVRIYDPDRHIIEIGEAMDAIAKRYLSMGKTAEEVSKIIQHPIEFVQAVQAGLLSK